MPVGYVRLCTRPPCKAPLPSISSKLSDFDRVIVSSLATCCVIAPCPAVLTVSIGECVYDASSFEDGTDSARRSPWSASVCTQYETLGHSVAERPKGEVAKNRGNLILERRLGVPGASNTLLQRIATSQCDQSCLFLRALGLVFDRFRGGENWRSRKGCCI